MQAYEVARGRPVWSVAALVAAVAEIVGQAMSSCTVRGEVSNVSRAASGHCYFNLKDETGSAAIRCALFRRAAQLSAFQPRDGEAVEVRGRLAVYEPRGELQLIVEAIRPAGAGALYERFLRLKALLEAEGLFDVARKRPLPPHPAGIGIVTSLAGAALHDVATTLGRRSPHVRVVVYPSLVQGEGAPAALCRAIARAGERAEVDVLVVCRGGGAIEDLWSFNDERVVRAIRACPMPVVSGVGHETDVTLADLAADLRAPTPTAAAELVAPATAAHLARLLALESALLRRTRGGLEREAQRLDRLALRLARPGEGVRRRGHAIDLLERRLATAFARRAEACRTRLAVQAQRLAALDPRQVLARGYALLEDAAGRPIVSVSGLAPSDAVRAWLRDGSARLSTIDVEPAVPGTPSAGG